MYRSRSHLTSPPYQNPSPPPHHNDGNQGDHNPHGSDQQLTTTAGGDELSIYTAKRRLRRALIGWFSYAWACEPFVVSAVGTYVPLLLEQYARYNGVWVGDHLTKCLDVTTAGETQSQFLVFGGQNNTNPDFPIPGEPFPAPPIAQCEVRFFGRWVDTSSFPLYTFSLSVLVQTLVVVSMSGAADQDHGHSRKRLLIGFALFGAICTCMFLVTGPVHYYWACALAILSNAAFGAVSVCGNAFLPVLAREMVYLNQTCSTSDLDNVSDETQPLLTAGNNNNLTNDNNNNPQREQNITHHSDSVATSQAVATISGQGVAIGYSGALLVQLGTMFLLLYLRNHYSSTMGIRIAVFLVGLWWLLFQIPVQLLLSSPASHLRPPFKSPQPPSTKLGSIQSHMAHVWKTIWIGWHTIGQALKQAKCMRDVCGFLVGWFIVSDALTTINSAAILFARVELQMSAPSLAVIGVLVVVSGIFGAMTVPKVRFNSQNPDPLDCVIFVILVAAVIPLYGMLGFVLQSLGLKHGWEMYMLGVWYGFALGGLNASCRYVYSLLIPKGSEAIFFSLFAVTDKGSSIIGPMISGFVTDKTHNIRYTFFFLFAMMALACVAFLGLVNVDRGMEEAQLLRQVCSTSSESSTVDPEEQDLGSEFPMRGDAQD